METTKNKIDEVVVSISDLHLGEGLRLPDGSENLHEDFLRDQEFANFLVALQSRYAPEVRIRLNLLGDIFDYHMVPIGGQYEVVPTEGNCLEQAKRIAQGHQKFFQALQKFLLDSRTSVVFFIGNHDFALEWDKVQEFIAELCSNDQPGRVSFAYAETHRRVLYTHGNFEPHNAVDITDRYLLPEDHRGLPEPVLNYPYGSYMNAALLPEFRRLHPYVGRLPYHGYWYKEAATRNWKLGLRVLYLVVKNFIHQRFFSFFDIQRKAHFIDTLKIIWWTAAGSRQEHVVKELLKRQPSLRAVVCGHDHVARAEKFGDKQFLNCGTWALTYSIDWEEQPNAPGLYRFFSRKLPFIAHIFRKPNYKKTENFPVILAEHAKEELNLGLYYFDPKDLSFGAVGFGKSS